MNSPGTQTIGIVSKPQIGNRLKVLEDLVEWCRKRDRTVLYDPVSASIIPPLGGRTCDRARMPEEADLVVVLGGDGTLLSVARHMDVREVPILGVNLGHLGFLTEISVSEMIPTLEAFLDGRAPVQHRMMLRVVLLRGGATPEATYHCLNDAVVTKSALARMIHLRVEVGDRWLVDMRADGLVLSTATGSTAYNLSAGGPILTAMMDGVILTPLCPHTLSMRPIVVDGSSPVRVTVLREAEKVFFTADGQKGTPMLTGDAIEAARSPFRVPLVTSPQRDYFALLREKLGWGTGAG